MISRLFIFTALVFAFVTPCAAQIPNFGTMGTPNSSPDSGTGVPGGITNSVQFNAGGGNFGGASGITASNTTLTLGSGVTLTLGNLPWAIAPGSLGQPGGTMSGYAAGDTIVLQCSGVTFSTSPLIGVAAVSGGAVTGATVSFPGITSSGVPLGTVNCSQTTGGTTSGTGYAVTATFGLIASYLSLPNLSTGGAANNGNLLLNLEAADASSNSFAGSESTFLGVKAGLGFTGNAQQLTAIGHNACGSGGTGTIGGNNLCAGTDAGRNIQGNSGTNSNTLVGTGAGRNIAGGLNTFTGAFSGGVISNIPGNLTGAKNAGYGYTAGNALTSGAGNLLLGTFAGSAIASGDGTIILGAPGSSASDNCSNGDESNVFAVCPGAGRVLTVTGGSTPSTSVMTIAGLANIAVAGSAAAPSLSVGNSTTGLYSVSTTGFCFVDVNGVCEADFGITASNKFSTANVFWNFGGSFGSSNLGGSIYLRNGSTNLSSPATAVWQLGTADAASPVAQTFQAQSVVAGNANTAGPTFTISGAKSNGSGGGDVVFQTTLSNAASGTQNTLATALTLSGGTQAGTFAGTLTVSGIGSDAAHTDTTVCQDTTSHLLLAGSGTAGICLGNVSSIRFKPDFHLIDDGLSVIRELDPGLYHYARGISPDDGTQLRTGYSAERYAQIMPEFTRFDAAGRPNGTDMLASLPFAVRAIQQLDDGKADKAEIVTVRAILRDLESKIEKLERRVH